MILLWFVSVRKTHLNCFATCNNRSFVHIICKENKSNSVATVY